MVVHMLSPDDSYDQLYISNYALLQVRDVVPRVKGVGNVQIFGVREYSMRSWLDPDKIASLGMTASEVVAALQAQNMQVAGGALAQPPMPNDQAFQPNLQLRGRLAEPAEFGEIVVKTGVRRPFHAAARRGAGRVGRRSTTPRTATSTASPPSCSWFRKPQAPTRSKSQTRSRRR